MDTPGLEQWFPSFRNLWTTELKNEIRRTTYSQGLKEKYFQDTKLFWGPFPKGGVMKVEESWVMDGQKELGSSEMGQSEGETVKQDSRKNLFGAQVYQCGSQVCLSIPCQWLGTVVQKSKHSQV